MVESELGKATILYEDPNEGTVEETVDNEHVAYFQDHWIIKTGEHEEGHDVVRRIPAQRVYFVERNVEAFEEEVGTLLDEVQSMADDIGLEVQTLRERLAAVTDELGTDLLAGQRTGDADSDVRHIDVETGELEEESTDDEDDEPPAGSV